MGTRARPARGKPVLFRLVKHAALGVGVANTTKQGYWIAPCAGRIVSLQCAAGTAGGTTDPTLGLWKGATLVTDEKALAASLTAYDLTPAHGVSDIVLAKGDHISMRGVSHAGDGVLTTPVICGIFEPGPGLRPDAMIADLFFDGSVGNNSALTDYRDWWIAPCDGRIENIQIIGQAQAGAAGPAIQVKNGSTAVCTKEEIVADDTVYEVTLTQDQRKFSRGDIFSLVVESDGTGELTNPTAIMTMIPLNANRARKHTIKLCKPDAALGVGVRDSVRQDIIIMPEDKRGRGLWLTKADVLQTNKAGATAEKAYFDFDVDGGLTKLDTIIETTLAGYSGRLKQVQVIDDATGLKASLDMATVTTAVDTVVEAAAAGVAGNAWTITLIPGAAAAAGIGIEDTTNKVFTFVYQDGVSDVDDFETVIAAAANLAVKTGGTGANVINDPADTTYANAMAGGTAVHYIDIVGGTLMRIHFKSAVTTVTNVETLITALAGADNIIGVKTGGTGANVLNTVGDVMAATNLAHGTDANPTYDIYKEGATPASVLDAPRTATADSAALAMVLKGEGNNRVKLANEDILSMRITTLPGTGETKEPVVMMELEI